MSAAMSSSSTGEANTSTPLTASQSSGVPTSVHITSSPSHQANYALISFDNGNVSVFELLSCSERVVQASTTGAIWALSRWDEEIFAAGGADGVLGVWDLKTLNKLCDFQGHTSTIRNLRFINSKTLISSSRDATLRVWDLSSQTCTGILSGHTATIRSFDYSSASDLLVSAGYENDARVWRVAGREAIHTLQGHTDKIYSVAVDREGEIVVTGSADKTAKIWDLQTGTCKATLKAHGLISYIIILPNTITISDNVGNIHTFSRQSYAIIYHIQAHENSITALDVDASGKYLVTGSSDGTVKMWNAQTGDLVKMLGEKSDAVWWAGWVGEEKVGAVLNRRESYAGDVSSEMTVRIDQFHDL